MKKQLGAEQETAPRQTSAQDAFVAWYLDNYPPRTIISVPEWHAPKIYRKAVEQLERDRGELIGALDYCVRGLERVLSATPVRDADEILHHARALLTKLAR